MHDDALAGLVQGGHQLLGDDHLAHQRMDCGRVELEKVGQYRNGDAIVDIAVGEEVSS